MAGLNDILGFQPEEPQQPGMSEVMNPQQAKGPSFLQNPKMAGMLLQGLVALSRTGEIGPAVQSAAMYGMAQEAANQEKAERDRKFNAEQADVAERRRLQGKQVDLEAERNEISRGHLENEGRRITNAEQTTGANVEYTRAQTNDLKQRTGQSADVFGLKIQQLELALQQGNINLQRAKTDIERQKILMQNDRIQNAIGALKLKHDEVFSPLERQAGIDKSAMTLAQGQESLAGTILDNSIKGQKVAALATMTPEELAAGQATQKPKSREERFQNYLRTKIENSQTGNVNIPETIREFEQIETQLTKGPGESSAPSGPVDQVAWTEARNKVKVGQKYLGPDGKQYVRKN